MQTDLIKATEYATRRYYRSVIHIRHIQQKSWVLAEGRVTLNFGSVLLRTSRLIELYRLLAIFGIVMTIQFGINIAAITPSACRWMLSFVCRHGFDRIRSCFADTVKHSSLQFLRGATPVKTPMPQAWLPWLAGSPSRLRRRHATNDFKLPQHGEEKVPLPVCYGGRSASVSQVSKAMCHICSKTTSELQPLIKLLLLVLVTTF